MRILNLLGRTVKIVRDVSSNDESYFIFPAARNVNAAIPESASGEIINPSAVLDGSIPAQVVRRSFMLPTPEENTLYIVPMSTAIAAVGREDLLYVVDEVSNDRVIEGTSLAVVTSQM